MKKYAIITDEETGAVSVGIGTDIRYYESIGMTLMDVEESEVDYQWYLTEKCPHYSKEELLKQEYKKEIESLKQQLANTDYQAIKYAEGAISEEEFAPTKAQRQAWRDRINELESQIDLESIK